MGNSEKPKYRGLVTAVDGLSLGISIVVAILIGVGLGILMRDIFGYSWLFWLGVFWGVSAGVLNIYKAYKRQKRSLDELADDPRYRHKKYDNDDEDD